MRLISLDLIKQHVRADFSDDDSYLLHLSRAAEEYVVSATNRTSDELLSDAGSYRPTAIQAMLLLIGHWYNQREGVAGIALSEAPYTISALLRPLTKLV